MKISPSLFDLEDSPSRKPWKKLDKWVEETVREYKEKLAQYKEKHGADKLERREHR